MQAPEIVRQIDQAQKDAEALRSSSQGRAKHLDANIIDSFEPTVRRLVIQIFFHSGRTFYPAHLGGGGVLLIGGMKVAQLYGYDPTDLSEVLYSEVTELDWDKYSFWYGPRQARRQFLGRYYDNTPDSKLELKSALSGFKSHHETELLNLRNRKVSKLLLYYLGSVADYRDDISTHQAAIKKSENWITEISNSREALDQFTQMLLAVDELSRSLELAEEVRELNVTLAKANKSDKQQTLKSKAARLDDKIRSEAKGIRRKIKPSDNCPYCAEPLDETMQLDHIYPIARGGLNLDSNLVFCCRPCNQKKSDLGLIEFVLQEGYDLNEVSSRLLALGKQI